jgi:uncharacterized protein DUF6529
MMNETPTRHDYGDHEAIESIRAHDSYSTRRSALWLAAPAGAFVLVSLVIGGLASRTAGRYPTPTFFHLFFSDTIHMKVWLATGVVGLAVCQVLTAARMFEVIRWLPGGRISGRLHRIFGYVAILLSLPVAYHCVFLLGFETDSLRVTLHSLLGSALYGAFLGKMIVVRSDRFPGWVLPIAGAVLFALLAGIWLTSSLYVFSTAGLAF